MARVIGIDPGTVSIDVCGLDNGRLFLDRAFSTSDALADPGFLIGVLEASSPLDLVVGPSGYGLPLTAARHLTETDLRLAFLAPEGESGGIAGLRSLVRALGRSPLPIVLTPGVVHLHSVPAHRKVNRIDMGTADKVCAAALALHEQSARYGCSPREVSFILAELGGAFTATLAVDRGSIVDGAGGTSGALGARAAGALDGEVAFLAGAISKAFLFDGGAAAIAGDTQGPTDAFATADTPQAQVARNAYVEGIVKSVAALATTMPVVREVILSGRLAQIDRLRDEIAHRLSVVMGNATVHVLSGFASVAKHAAQGAALIADGLVDGTPTAGGSELGTRALVDALGIREASGTVLDHLYVMTPAAARARLLR